MTSETTKRLFLCCAPLALLMIAACDFTSNVTLNNQSGHALTPYPVKVTPPPPHREADPANIILEAGTTPIDPHGFNPVFYTTGISDVSKANGIYIGLDLDDASPMMIQYKVFHYKVPPGEAGKDPANQPILLHQGVVEVEDVDQMITVSWFGPAGVPLPPGGWRVVVEPE
jgi:hypothetical protein